MSDLYLNPDLFRQTLREVEQQLPFANDLQARADKLAGISRVLNALPMSWAQQDPGKYRPAYCMIDRHGKHVIARELLPDGIEQFTGTQQEWRSHVRELGFHRSFDMVPPDLEIVDLEEVSKLPCPECGTLREIVQSYRQTYDSPDGDQWQKQELVLCCDEVRILRTETSPYRF